MCKVKKNDILYCMMLSFIDLEKTGEFLRKYNVGKKNTEKTEYFV